MFLSQKKNPKKLVLDRTLPSCSVEFDPFPYNVLNIADITNIQRNQSFSSQFSYNGENYSLNIHILIFNLVNMEKLQPMIIMK